MRENCDFVVPVNILTTFACALFSWAAWHTTVCLDMAWKFYYFTHILKDENWTSIDIMIDYGTSQTLKLLDKIYLNYEILRTEIWTMSPEIFLKDEIWTLIFENDFQSLPTPRGRGWQLVSTLVSLCGVSSLYHCKMESCGEVNFSIDPSLLHHWTERVLCHSEMIETALSISTNGLTNGGEHSLSQYRISGSWGAVQKLYVI